MSKADNSDRLLRLQVQKLQAELDRRAGALAEMARLRDALEAAEARAAEQDKRLQALAAGQDTAWNRLAGRTADLREARARIAALEARAGGASDPLADRVAALEAERARLLASLSWRLTRPLRAGRSLLAALKARLRR